MRRAHWLHTLRGYGRRLAAYAADELPPAERARLAFVVEACPACRHKVEVYQRMAAALRGLPRVGLTANEAAAFLPEVNRRIDRKSVV